MKLFVLVVLTVTIKFCITSEIAEKCEQFKKDAQNRPEYQPDENPKKAKLGEFPHITGIFFEKEVNKEYIMKCTGILITPKFVLAPAHCFLAIHSSYRPFHVRVGFIQVPSTINSFNPNSDYKIKSVKLHPQYHSRKFINNIAIVELAGYVIFNDNIRPACLSNDDNVDAQQLVSTHWRLSPDGSQYVLYKNPILSMEPEQCLSIFQSKSINLIKSEHFCINNTWKDICKSDIGGPLQVPNGKLFSTLWIQFFGPRGCGQSLPYVFTSVTRHLAWIEIEVDEFGVPSSRKCKELKSGALDRPEYQPDENTKPAKLGEFPHIAAIIYKDKKNNMKYRTRCIGTLISKKHVLLPAHCIAAQPTHVRLGSIEVPSLIENLNPNIDYEIKSTKVHKEFSSDSSNYTGYNIAIIELTKDVIFTDSIRPACLNIDKNINFKKLVFTEWAQLEGDNNGLVLLKHNILQVETKNCSLLYRNEIINYGHICLTKFTNIELKGFRGSYIGGTSQIPNGKLFSIVTIPSLGIGRGLYPHIPDASTSVEYYLDWIQNIINE